MFWGLFEYTIKQEQPAEKINNNATLKEETISNKQNPALDPLFPKLVGNNVEFPANIIENTTPGYTPGDKFYIAIHENGWNPQEGDKNYEMENPNGTISLKFLKDGRHIRLGSPCLPK